MEEFHPSKRKEKGLARPAWILTHLGIYALLTVLYCAIPMYESKVGEETFVYGFFFEAVRGMEAAPAAVFFSFFGIFVALSLCACAFLYVAYLFDRKGRLERSDRYFALAVAFFIGAHALNCLVCISLSLVIPLCLSIFVALLGFASLYRHAKKYSELAGV